MGSEVAYTLARVNALLEGHGLEPVRMPPARCRTCDGPLSGPGVSLRSEPHMLWCDVWCRDQFRWSVWDSAGCDQVLDVIEGMNPDGPDELSGGEIDGERDGTGVHTTDKHVSFPERLYRDQAQEARMLGSERFAGVRTVSLDTLIDSGHEPRVNLSGKRPRTESDRALEAGINLYLNRAAITAKEREALGLIYWQGLSFRQASDALGLSISAAESRVGRAVNKLRTALVNDIEQGDS